MFFIGAFAACAVLVAVIWHGAQRTDPRIPSAPTAPQHYSPEYIVAAATRHPNGAIIMVERPGRHHTINNLISEWRGIHPFRDPAVEERTVQGFVTSRGRFVDRYEGRRIATEGGQLLERATNISILTSEDVW